MKVQAVDADPKISHMFWCPGCRGHHYFGPGWSFNGDLAKPTVSPSILVRTCYDGVTPHVCHMFVRDGQLQYLSDCTHDLAGQTVDMVEVAP